MNKKIEKIAGTIAALASARGSAGIAVIRVSGPLAKECFSEITKKTPKHRSACYTSFYGDNNKEIDKGISLFFEGPNSYTGEDVIEFSTHGSPAIVEMMLSRIYALGVREAEPGEFTKRAYLNDKMDLTQAEAVADLIESTTSRTAMAAKRSLSGEFSLRVRDLSNKITETRALAEAMLDFSDQDLDETKHPAALLNKLDEAAQSFEALIDQTRVGIMVRKGIIITIMGEPNVGKSSLFNKICGNERAIVSSKAGTTRDIVSENITIDGFPVRILDTAGLRYSDDEIEQEGVKRALEASKSADIVLEVIDANSWNKNNTHNDNTLVLNKADLLEKKLEIDTKKTFLLSAKTGDGVDKLLDHIAGQFVHSDNSESSVTARERHLHSIKEAHRAFCEAERHVAEKEALDLVAEELLQAQNSLAEVTGEFTTEDLLEEIFNSFCIGK